MKITRGFTFLVRPIFLQKIICYEALVTYVQKIVTYVQKIVFFVTTGCAHHCVNNFVSENHSQSLFIYRWSKCTWFFWSIKAVGMWWALCVECLITCLWTMEFLSVSLAQICYSPLKPCEQDSISKITELFDQLCICLLNEEDNWDLTACSGSAKPVDATFFFPSFIF